jgi:anion-transporting  ArsA/GET3 family ATPase
VNTSTASETLAKRLLVVTGKGGVGKSTIARALALAAGRGLRTIVVEVAGRGATRTARRSSRWTG